MARLLPPQYRRSLLQHHQDSQFQLPFHRMPSFQRNQWTQFRRTSVSLQPVHQVAIHLNSITRSSPRKHHTSLSSNASKNGKLQQTFTLITRCIILSLLDEYLDTVCSSWLETIMPSMKKKKKLFSRAPIQFYTRILLSSTLVRGYKTRVFARQFCECGLFVCMQPWLWEETDLCCIFHCTFHNFTCLLCSLGIKTFFIFDGLGLDALLLLILHISLLKINISFISFYLPNSPFIVF